MQNVSSYFLLVWLIFRVFCSLCFVVLSYSHGLQSENCFYVSFFAYFACLNRKLYTTIKSIQWNKISSFWYLFIQYIILLLLLKNTKVIICMAFHLNSKREFPTFFFVSTFSLILSQYQLRRTIISMIAICGLYLHLVHMTVFEIFAFFPMIIFATWDVSFYWSEITLLVYIRVSSKWDWMPIKQHPMQLSVIINFPLYD